MVHRPVFGQTRGPRLVPYIWHYALNLFMAITPSGKKSVRDGLFQGRWVRDIVGTPTMQVLCQYLRVWNTLRDVVLDPLQEDRFVWTSNAEGDYSAFSAYKAFFQVQFR